MQKFLQKLLRKPVLKLADKYSSRPNTARVQEALMLLYNQICTEGKKGKIVNFDSSSDRFIILSDQHKGTRNGSDDFAFAERNYLAALGYYFQNNYFYINLGDSEELWENTWYAVKKCNTSTFEKEKLFFDQKRFIKLFGNHDLYWDNDPLARFELEKVYGKDLCVYEGAVLSTTIDGQSLKIYLTHGHQGDAVSDGNWFSKWFISKVWAPLQSYLAINPNTPAYDVQLKTLHNKLMYDWSALQKNLILITGHTHQPVFESLTLLEKLYKQLGVAIAEQDEKNRKRLEEEIRLKTTTIDNMPDFTNYKPSYFNTGCCCFSDGDITGIEIAEGMIRLVKWEYTSEQPQRILLEEVSLKKFIDK
jgi:predicted phosphodiesterase